MCACLADGVISHWSSRISALVHCKYGKHWEIICKGYYRLKIHFLNLCCIVKVNRFCEDF
jgi:hypothetical protein